MSYSFSLTAATKADAKHMIREKFDGVIESQPKHAADKESAVVAGQTLVDLLAEPHEGDKVIVSMNGYLSWTFDGEITQASVSVTVGLQSPPKAA